MAEWYYSQGGQSFGPMAQEHLAQLMASGQVGPQDLARRDGMASWEPAGSLPEFAGVAQPPPPYPQGGQFNQPPPYGQPGYAQPLGYQTPVPPQRYANANDDMTGLDWVLAILCPGIGCIIGIIRMIQGKKSGGKLLGFSILFAVIWNIIRFVIEAGSR